MAQGANLLIHTDSAYAPGLDISITQGNYSLTDLYDAAYDNLRTAELAFYHHFYKDVDSIDEFIHRLRDLFAEAEKDAAYLKRFTNANLSKYIPNSLDFYFNQNYRIKVTGDINKIALSFKGESCYMEGDLYITISPENARLIKHILNEGLNRRGNNRFQDNDKITQNLVDILSLNKTNGLFQIIAGNNPTQPKNQEFDITAVSKKEYTKKNLDDLFKSNDPAKKEQLSQLRMEARKSLNEMKNFLFSQLPPNDESGKNPMREAVEEVWKEIFPSMGEDVLLRNFFFEGKNYAKSLLGQGGEFYNEVLIRYLAKKTDNPVLSKIIGSIVEGGQQPHSDLQIMIEVGADIAPPNFQTKNVKGTKRIEVKTNASLIQPNFGPGMTSALVNYYANTDYETAKGDIITEVKDLLQERFFQAMNLNVAPKLDDMQTNTFYFVGGDKIIPGSEIIQDIQNLGQEERPRFDISGDKVSPSLSNEEYEKNFTEYFYWKYSKGHNIGPENMIPTPKNPPAFRKAATSISIKTSFDVSALIDSGRFTIFY